MIIALIHLMITLYQRYFEIATVFFRQNLSIG